MSSAGVLSYDSIQPATTARTLETEIRVISTGLSTKLEAWMNGTDAATAQVDVITVATPVNASDAYYKVTIQGTTRTETFVVESLTAATLTNADIAARLAARINLHPDVAAVQGTGGSANVVTVTAVVPGTNGAFTSTVSCNAVADNSAITSKISRTTTAGTGTGKVRKVGELTITFAATTATAQTPSFPTFTVSSGSWFNGAASPASAGTFGPTTFTGTRSVDTLAAVA